MIQTEIRKPRIMAGRYTVVRNIILSIYTDVCACPCMDTNSRGDPDGHQGPLSKVSFTVLKLHCRDTSDIESHKATKQTAGPAKGS